MDKYNLETYEINYPSGKYTPVKDEIVLVKCKCGELGYIGKRGQCAYIYCKKCNNRTKTRVKWDLVLAEWYEKNYIKKINNVNSISA